MIHPIIEKFICSDLEKIMIKAEDVASLISTHTLGHGLLVLSQVKYSLIPVLSTKSQLVGLISMPLIINAAMTIDSIDLSLLDERKISNAMEKMPRTVTLDTELEVILHLLIDQNFVCVTDPDNDNRFIGLITRKEIMKRLNYFIHNISYDDSFIVYLESLLGQTAK